MALRSGTQSCSRPCSPWRNHVTTWRLGWQARRGLQGAAQPAGAQDRRRGWNPPGGRRGDGEEQREHAYRKGEKVGREGRRGEAEKHGKFWMREWTQRRKAKAGGQSGSTERDARTKEAKGRWGWPWAGGDGPGHPHPRGLGGLVKPCVGQQGNSFCSDRISRPGLESTPGHRDPEGALVPHHQELWAQPTGPLPLVQGPSWAPGAAGAIPELLPSPRRCRLLLSPWSPTFCSEPPQEAVPKTKDRRQRTLVLAPQPRLRQGQPPCVIPELSVVGTGSGPCGERDRPRAESALLQCPSLPPGTTQRASRRQPSPRTTVPAPRVRRATHGSSRGAFGMRLLCTQ